MSDPSSIEPLVSSARLPVRPWKLWSLVGVIAVVLGVGFLLWRDSPVPKEPASELVARLIQRDGRLYSPDSTEPFTGWMVDYFPDSTFKSRSWVSKGVLDGVSEGWHTNGVLQVREHFVRGISEGPVAKWYPDGAKQSEGIAKHGRLEGPFRRWHPNGTPSEEVTLVDGKPEGLSRSWYPSGNLKAEVTLRSGQVISKQYWKDGEAPEMALTKSGGGR